MQSRAQAKVLAERVIASLSQPYDLDGHQVVVGASIGIAGAPTDSGDADELLKMAEMALYRGKLEGRGVFRFFEPEMDAKVQSRRRLEVDLRKALAAEELEIHYQPVVDLASDWRIADVAVAKRFIPRRLMSDKLYAWFQDALQAGRIADGTAELKGALDGTEAGEIRAKSEALMEAAHKLAQAVYEQVQAQDLVIGPDDMVSLEGRVTAQQVEEHADGRGLPGAVGADVPDHLTAFHGEGEVAHRVHHLRRTPEAGGLAPHGERAREMLDLDQRHGQLPVDR